MPIVIEQGTNRYRGLVAVGLAVAVLVVLWASGLDPFQRGQVTRVLIYAVAIAGLNVATGYTGLLSVGHSAFFGIGAYTTGILVEKAGWGAWATLPVAAVCFAVGLLVGLPALRIRGLYLAMVTLAFAVAFPEIVARFDGLTGGAGGMAIHRVNLRPPAWSGFTLGEKDKWLFWVAVVVLAIVTYLIANLTRSRYGLAMSAVRQNEIAASASGVNIAIVKVTSFGISGAITGAGGGLFAIYLGNLYAEGSFTLMAGISLLIGLVIGGERTMLGPIVGGCVLIYVPYYTADIGQGQASAVLFAVALLLVIFLAPSGIVGGLGQLSRRILVVRPGRPALGRGSVPAAPASSGGHSSPNDRGHSALDEPLTGIERQNS